MSVRYFLYILKLLKICLIKCSFALVSNTLSINRANFTHHVCVKKMNEKYSFLLKLSRISCVKKQRICNTYLHISCEKMSKRLISGE